MTHESQTRAAADSGASPTKPHIPSPEELLEETPLIYTSNYDTQDLIKFCGTQLTNYKVPKQIEFRTALPKTNVGKILRRALREGAPEATPKTAA